MAGRRMSGAIISKNFVDEVVERFQSGEPVVDIAEFFDVSEKTVRKRLKDAGKHVRPDGPRLRNRSIRKFVAACRSQLWRMDPREHTHYWAWKKRVEFFEKNENYDHAGAIIRASKEFIELHCIFGRYDIKSMDREPDSHPSIEYLEDRIQGGLPPPMDKPVIENQNIKQPTLDNLHWAMQSAGEFKRTGKAPLKCPNDEAYFLYEEALSNGKEFLSRFTQAEKGSQTDETEQNIRRHGEKSVSEINEMLEGI